MVINYIEPIKAIIMIIIGRFMQFSRQALCSSAKVMIGKDFMAG
jgi:hypothetical protein